MWLLHVMETSPNLEGALSSPSFPRESLLIILCSYVRSIRQSILGISPPLYPHLHYIPADQRRRSHFLVHFRLRFRSIHLNLPSPSIRRRPPLLRRLPNSIQRVPRAQISACLPRAQLDWHPPCHVLRKGR